MTMAEGGGRNALVHKFRDVYVPTLKANYLLWPAVQILNFRVMPIQFQIVSNHFSPFLRANDQLANVATAFCVECRNCMDRVSVPDQFCGRALE